MALNPTRPAYVPPHLRDSNGGLKAVPPPLAPSAPAAAALNGSASPPSTFARVAPAAAAATGFAGPRGTYAPPAARSTGGGDWGAPPMRSGGGAPAYGGGGGAPNVRVSDGFGGWKDGKHVVGPRNVRMEHELYGEVGDGQHQVSLRAGRRRCV